MKLQGSDAVDVKLKYLVKKKEHANEDTASEIMLFHCACIELDLNSSCFP